MAKYRNSRFLSLKEVLDDMIREMRIGSKMDDMKVRKHWHALMGSYITNHTSRVYFRQGKLYVHLESSVLKQELFMARERIIASLNARLEEELVQELIIR